MGLLRRLNELFRRRERWQLGVLFLALVLRAAVEMVGVASVMPFMRVVADPTVVHRNEYFQRVYEAVGSNSEAEFLIVLGVGVVVLLALANGTNALVTYGVLRFSWGMHHRLSVRLLNGLLAQPYAFFVQRNTASLSKTLLSEVQSVVNGVLTPVLDFGSRFMVTAALVTLLLVINPTLAFLVALLLGGGYGTAYMAIKRRQRQLGEAKVRANQERYKAAGEALGGIKDVKVLRREAAFLERFAPASFVFSRAAASNAIVGQLPRYLLETIAYGAVVLIVLFLLRSGGDINQALPLITLYALAGLRLMPELQKMFADLANIRFNRAALDAVLADYHDNVRLGHQQGDTRLTLTKEIRFENVTFQYAGASECALKNVSLQIPRNQTIGFVGPSGSGKTTLVDLLLGLHEPTEGVIWVDDTTLDHAAISGWQRLVGYVPQQIFLTDDTIAANIAFGVRAAEVDAVRLQHAARVAHLHDFVATLEHGYDTVVGERGVRMSGGQRQRIGIARALYHDPAVLILDEATSALDGGTETAVMDAIRALTGKKTIVIVAHRLTTVKDCDRIALLVDGRVEMVDTYQGLLRTNATFRGLVGVG